MGRDHAGDGSRPRGAAEPFRRRDAEAQSGRIPAAGLRRPDGDHRACVGHEAAEREQERADRARELRERVVLSAERNRLLTEVGPGTPMGDYLRRYWMPIGGATEFDRIEIKPMRLFGEDLVLYR